MTEKLHGGDLLTGVTNTSLTAAKRAKNDEFYTQLPDIERELRHYREHFKNKVVYCNCDDPYVSAFFTFFSRNFEFLGLKKLITTCYRNAQHGAFSKGLSDQAIKLVYEGGADHSLPEVKDIGVIPLQGDGDFRSEECVEILKEADIVVTNPPFSLFREYVAQMMEHGKKFLIVGNMNAITYKEIFPLIKENKLWLGINSLKFFVVPEGFSNKSTEIENGKRIAKFGNILWYTNLDYNKRHEELILIRRYQGNETAYPTYDNYGAINIDKVADIPLDYAGVMGVPITFLDKYNPEQFEILSANDIISNPQTPKKPHGLIKDKDGAINGIPKYARIVIRNLHPEIQP